MMIDDEYTDHFTGGISPEPFGANMAATLLDEQVHAGLGDTVAMRFIARDWSITEFTYADLVDASWRVAWALRNLGIAAGEAVFTLAGRIPGGYQVALGILRANAVLCPLFSVFGPEPIRQRLELGRAVAVVTTTSLYRRRVLPIAGDLTTLRHVLLIDAERDHELLGDGPGGHRVHCLEALMSLAPERCEIEPTDPEDTALLHFTSGTTGMPKGALHVHAAAHAHRETAQAVFGLAAGDVYWCTADPGWVTGTSYGLSAPLACGVTMVVDEADVDVERWYEILEHQRINVWYTAPTAIRMLMRAGDDLVGGRDLGALRVAASVGEPLDADAVRWGQRVLGAAIHDTWWQTETGSIMIAMTPDIDLRPGSMGRPLAGIDAELFASDEDGELELGPTGQPVVVDDPETPGILALRSGWSSMFRGYLDAEDRYRKCFVDEWYLSGDLARRDGDGYFWFVGRSDDVIKTAGHLIGPFEVEQVLTEHASVVLAGVYGVPDETAGALIHACIVLSTGTPETEQLLRDVMAHARRRLGPAVAPRQIKVVEDLPVTRSGKIMRRVLRARELGLDVGDLSTLENPGAQEER
jgi:acetyl-CoA synthetase